MDMAISIAQHEAIYKYSGTDEKHDVWKLLERQRDAAHADPARD
jgi:hypothetical protein